ncbi:uncharacterized protein TM35_000052390 [Trypanosoma theileri]|uniref:Uncharacterized protein n=1 Tax=Trypanosoma theileri TaxID=67003 RepID=A0A1X0P4R5_9TRYP|nr:uncharacterized protein TM35_000052390 [Trypanosoma theileri]ORC91643.1 hypothetical protein TM35_000052390 [Trypanosoma theileri]
MSIETEPETTDLLTVIVSTILIPSWAVLLASGFASCFINVFMNCFLYQGSMGKIIRYMRALCSTKDDEHGEYGYLPIEVDPSLGNWVLNNLAHNFTFFQPEENMTPSSSINQPEVVANEALQNSLQYVRLEAQRMVFVYNPKYMIIATAKSLIMLMIIQYHFDFKGGWDRLVVCCAANLMSGLLTPVLEYGARLLLPLDLDCGRKDLVVEPEEPKDSVLIVEVLVQIGRLELEDLETVLIQCSTFIVFGAVLLPAAVVFCVAGFSAFIWVFSPIWLVYALVRYFYYRSASVGVQASSGRGGDVLFTPAGEFVKAALLKVMTLFLLQWTIQCSFLFGLVLLQGGKYVEALRTEAHYQILGWYNPMEMNQFQFLCFVSQVFF